MRNLFSLVFLFIAAPLFSQQQLITCLEKGSSWKVYKPAGAASKSFVFFHFEDFPTYSDDDWVQLPTPLGFNTPGLAADLTQSLENPQDRVAFYLFNSDLPVQHYPTDIDSLYLKVRYNDAFVAYLNGVEVVRKNIAAFPTPISETTTATAVHDGSDYELIDITLFKATLINGNSALESANQIAVELHQSTAEVKDLVFDMEVYYTRKSIATPVPLVVRKPYLQMSGPTSMSVHWRTNTPTATELSYGTSQLMGQTTYTDTNKVTDHEAKLTGLTPSTKYYYSIQGVNTYLNDPINQYFTTAPIIGADAPVRIWVIGDFGIGLPPQTTTFLSYLAANAGKTTNLWMWAGDNAYQSGTDQQYQDNVFGVYDPIFRNHVVCPTTGNHDMESCNPERELGPYFDIFNLPRNGELGGVASGTEAYNSYNYGPLHIVNIESSKVNADADGPMAKWLQKDLAENQQKWIIAHFHHPVYSGGSHKSDDHGRSQLMRENMLPLLEAGGVDLVINGHSHDYERSFLVDGHYGLSTDFNAAQNLVQTGDGNADGFYHKPKESPYSHKGMVAALVGNSGLTDVSETVDVLPVMAYTTVNPGSAIVTLSGDTLHFEHLDAITNTITDEFYIVKDLEAVPCNIDLNLPSEMSICPGMAIELDAGAGFKEYNWSTGSKTRKTTLTQPGTYSLTVKKSASCVKQYVVKVVSKLPTGFIASKEIAMVNEVITFDDTTSGAVSRTWNFDNGMQSSAAHAETSYSLPGLYQVTLTNSDGTCTNTASRQLTIAEPSGVEKTQQGELRILAYPNPTDGILNLELESLKSIENIDVLLLNANGAEVYHKKLGKLDGSHTERINLSGSADGAYYLTVKYPGGVYTKKIILH